MKQNHFGKNAERSPRLPGGGSGGSVASLPQPASPPCLSPAHAELLISEALQRTAAKHSNRYIIISELSMKVKGVIKGVWKLISVLRSDRLQCSASMVSTTE